jgi:glyoxylase-like metal-dependent hydrolase (beta-lactamase superfamily II)
MFRCLIFAFLFAVMPAAALQPEPVADGVYAFVGVRGEIGPANQGNVGNSGFIVGRSGVIVIDSGASYAYGKQMIAAIRGVTDKPIALVIFTHAVQEFVFGAAAFTEIGAQLLTHAKSAELMRERCNHCLENLRAQLGTRTMAGTRLIIPQQTLEQSQALSAGGREIDVLYFGWASTPGDVVVLDRATGVAFTGGLVGNRRIPELRDGHVPGWLDALAALKRTSARTIVPGHGPVGGVELADVTAEYLRALDAQVQSLYQRGATLTQTVDNVALTAYEDWDLYPMLHRQNALHRFLQLETEELSR